MCAIKNENYGVQEKYLKSQFYLVFFLKNDVFSIQPCTVWEDDIYDKCFIQLENYRIFKQNVTLKFCVWFAFSFDTV